MIYHNFLLWLAKNFVPALSIVVIVGAGLYSVIAPAPTFPELDALVEHTVTLEGVVIKDPERREKTTHLTVRLEKINGEVLARHTRVLIFADTFSEVQYGDRVQVEGKLKNPEPFETDSGRTFNYPKFLLAHGITHTVSFPESHVLARGEGHFIVHWLLSIKHTFVRGIESALPEPESALLAGLILGEKQSLGTKITEAFRNAGVVHIIVLSGYNVSLVISWVTFVLLRFLPHTFAYSLAGLFVIGFGIMTGASETTVRAILMALIMMLATVLHRPKAALRVLLVAAAVMALASPHIVLYDLSFQLSVLATLGLILFSKSLENKIGFVPDFKYFPLRQIIATTLATQAVVLPLLILSIGAVSLVFLPANVLVLPAVPIAMFVGFFASLSGMLSPLVALPLSTLAYVILHYIIGVAVFLGSLPFSAVTVPREWIWPLMFMLSGFYAFVGFLHFCFRKKIAFPPHK